MCVPILQKGPEGRYLITVPKKVVEFMGWEKGDVINFTSISKYTDPRPGDIVVRHAGYNTTKHP